MLSFRFSITNIVKSVVEWSIGIKSQYNNFNLSWINLPYYLKEHEVFIGDLSKLGSIDPTLVTQFEKNKIKYEFFTIH